MRSDDCHGRSRTFTFFCCNKGLTNTRSTQVGHPGKRVPKKNNLGPATQQSNPGINQAWPQVMQQSKWMGFIFLTFYPWLPGNNPASFLGGVWSWVLCFGSLYYTNCGFPAEGRKFSSNILRYNAAILLPSILNFLYHCDLPRKWQRPPCFTVWIVCLSS